MVLLNRLDSLNGPPVVVGEEKKAGHDRKERPVRETPDRALFFRSEEG